jgi:hypothetical protein
MRASAVQRQHPKKLAKQALSQLSYGPERSNVRAMRGGAAVFEPAQATDLFTETLVDRVG